MKHFSLFPCGFRFFIRTFTPAKEIVVDHSAGRTSDAQLHRPGIFYAIRVTTRILQRLPFRDKTALWVSHYLFSNGMCSRFLVTVPAVLVAKRTMQYAGPLKMVVSKISRFRPTCERKTGQLPWNKFVTQSQLRRQDSNVRPPGYEPGELPTAPLRDVSCFAGAKVLLFSELSKFLLVFFEIIVFFGQKSWLFELKSLILHTSFRCAIS